MSWFYKAGYLLIKGTRIARILPIITTTILTFKNSEWFPSHPGDHNFE
jgi:hypothetical protein